MMDRENRPRRPIAELRTRRDVVDGEQEEYKEL